MSSAVTIAAVTTAVVAAGSAAYSIANKPSAPKLASANLDSGAANTSPGVTNAAAAGPGRAANIAAGDDGSLNDTTDQYSVKKKLLGD